MAVNNASQKRADISGPRKAFAAASGAVTAAEPAALAQAQAHKDKLLAFQASNAARTTVVDEAAAFETPETGVNMWGSATERARQLKKQQKVLREMEWAARPEYEKRRVVVSVDLVGGKVVKRMGNVERTEEPDEDDTANYDAGDEVGARVENGNQAGGGAFARNPLLGGLVRPVWRGDDGDGVGADGDGKGKGKAVEGNTGQARRERVAPWRRVQDDNDDNEELILNGGVYGGRESERIFAEEPARG